MNILVIGNGFDLAHDLPTKYEDFMNFIKVFKYLKNNSQDYIKKMSEFKKLSSNIKDYLLSESVFVFTNHSDIIKEFDKYVHTNIWIKWFNNTPYLQGKGWIDFEYEISRIIKSLDFLLEHNNKILRNFNKEVTDNTKYQLASQFLNKIKNDGVIDHNKKFKIENFHGQVAMDIIDELHIELNNLIRCLEIYLEEFVGKIDIKKRLKDIEELTEIDKIISFNYTNTYEKIYDYDKKCEYDYIHGKLDISKEIEKNNMVLGIDEYLEGVEKDYKVDFIKFKKYFQRLYKQTGCLYKIWLEKKKSLQGNAEINRDGQYINKLYIYGHSLDITDKDILKELINFTGTQTTIYYYDKDDYARKITNMVRIIGQDDLKEKCYGNNPKIKFKEIQR